MKNKRLAICLSIFAFLVILIILSSTIFALQSVSVCFLSTTNKLNGFGEQIVTSANFNFGQNVLFLNKNTYIKRIEKEFAYIKILNVETIFPNKLVINAIERQDTFAVKLANNSYAIIDDEFKVLNVVDNYINSTKNAIPLLNLSNISEKVESADNLSFEENQQNVLTNVFSGLLEWQNKVSLLTEKIESITLDYERTNQVAIKMFSGVTIVVKDANEYTSDKLNLVFSAYEANEKYQKNGILEVRVVKNTETNEKELRVFYQSA